MRLLLDGFFNAAGHENNRLLRLHGFNSADDLKATLLGHFEVTDHYIILAVLDVRGADVGELRKSVDQDDSADRQ